MANRGEPLTSDLLGTTIRFFLSSTFADFQTERDVLQERVFPELRTLCAQSGFRLQPIDLRWGVSEEAGTERQTLRICFDELERCRQLSLDFILLILLGDRYGSYILPPQVPGELITRLLPRFGSEERRSFDAAYRVDENAVPAEYVLLRAEGPERAEDEALRRALARACREAHVSEDERLLFEGSATHREIQHGLLKLPPGSSHEQGVLCAVRRFGGTLQGAEAARFGEQDPAQVARVQQLTEAVVRRLPEHQVLRYEVAWDDTRGPAFDEAVLAHHYMGLLRPKVEAVISARVAARRAAEAKGHDEGALANAAFAAQRARRVEGREVELARLAAYLAGREGERRPLVVTGAAGSGKSTLLAEAAKRVAVTQPGAVLLIRYIGVTPGTGSLLELLNGVRSAIARAYGQAEPGSLADQNALIAACAAQLAALDAPPERPLLLLVDALDQLSATAERTDWLPARLAPGVRVVVSVLGDRPELTGFSVRLPAEQVLTLGPMAPAAGRAMLHDLLDEAPQRTLTPTQEVAVLSAFATQGLPLYLRLVAAEARRWCSFDPPRLGAITLPQTVSELLEAILARLEAPERYGRVLVAQALGDLAAARFGLAEDELLDLLARDPAVRAALHALSPRSPKIDGRLPLPVALWARLHAEVEPLLIEREADAGTRLYTFYHQQLRAAVEARYLSGGGIEHHRALAAYFEEQPWQLGPNVWNWRKVRELVTQQERAGDRAGAEETLTDLATTLEQVHLQGQQEAARHGRRPERINALIYELINTQTDRLTTGSHFRAGLRFHTLQLAIAREVGDRVREGITLNNLGVLSDDLGQLEAARGYYEQALSILREVGDQAEEGNTLTGLGIVTRKLGQTEAAQRYYEQALSIAREVGDREREGGTLNSLGLLYSGLEQAEVARSYYEQALSIRREVGDRAGEGSTLSNLGMLAHGLGQLEVARSYYEQALSIRREVGDRAGEGVTLNNLAELTSRLGQTEAAQRYYEQALSILREVGDREGEGGTLNNLGELSRKLGQTEAAQRYYEQALSILREVGSRAAEGRTLNNLGLLAFGLKQPEAAQRYYEQALSIAREVGDRLQEGGTLNNLGSLARDFGQADVARRYYEQALSILREVGSREVEGAILNNLGLLNSRLGQAEAARRYYEQALSIAREMGNRAVEGPVLAGLGALSSKLGQVEAARHYFEQALIVLREVGNRAGEGSTLANLGALAYGSGQAAAAQHYFEQALEIFQDMGAANEANAVRANLAVLSMHDTLATYVDSLSSAAEQERPATAPKHDAGPPRTRRHWWRFGR